MAADEGALWSRRCRLSSGWNGRRRCVVAATLASTVGQHSTLANPTVVCRGAGDPFNVREESSWVDISRVFAAESCKTLCEHLNPQYECYGTCLTSGVDRGKLASMSGSALKQHVCNCSAFVPAADSGSGSGGCGDVVVQPTGLVVCRCGTRDALEARPVPEFDAVRDLDSTSGAPWSEADASFWHSDSDGFDVLPVKEPTYPRKALAATAAATTTSSTTTKNNGGDDDKEGDNKDDDDSNNDTPLGGNDDETMYPTHFQVLSKDPRIYYYPNFLSDSEVDHYLVVASPNLTATAAATTTMGLLRPQEPVGRDVQRWEATLVDSAVLAGDEVLLRIVDRVSAEAKVPRSYLHPLELMRYQHNQPRPVIISSPPDVGLREGGGGQNGAGSRWHDGGSYSHYQPRLREDVAAGSSRIATFIFSLSDAEAGGETIFTVRRATSLRRGVLPCRFIIDMDERCSTSRGMI
jgi:hypothetical protein